MNDAMQPLGVMVGDWDLTMTNAWFLDSLETELHGQATIEWLADAFLVVRIRMEGGSPSSEASTLVFGRSDARDAYYALYHDNRGVYRLFDVTRGPEEWTLLREDPDFHQRLTIRPQPDRIHMRAYASDDEGRTWRTDLDYILTRRASAGGNRGD